MEKYITEVTINNFKCFETFKMSNIGQFNLIAGDNNIGKTSLLEALVLKGDIVYDMISLTSFYANKYGLDSNRLNEIAPKKNIVDLFVKKSSSEKRSFSITKKTTNNLEDEDFLYELIDLKKLDVVEKTKELDRINKNKLGEINSLELLSLTKNNTPPIYSSVNITDLAPHYDKIDYYPFIHVGAAFNKDIVKFYINYVQKNHDIRTKFFKQMAFFIPDIDFMEVSSDTTSGTETLIVWIKGKKEPLDLAFFGEGTSKFVRIILELIICSNGQIMIDEIDTGIHYSRFKEYWKTIIKSAKENNVQLFATTHSLECMKYFKEALADDDMKDLQKDSRYYYLTKDKIGKIISKKFDFPQFEHALEYGNEIR